MDAYSIDKKVKNLIKKCSIADFRSLFVIFGSNGWKNIPAFYELMARGKMKKFSLLWCSKETPDFIVNIEDVLNEIFTKKNTEFSNEEKTIPKCFSCSYDDGSKMLYQSYNIVVLQDFEEITPLAFVSFSEVVKGGGALVLLSNQIKSLEELQSVNVAACNTIKASRFFRRFFLSLKSYPFCIVLDDGMHILSYEGDAADICKHLESKRSEVEELQKLKMDLDPDSNISALVRLCRTVDQAKLLLKILDVLKKRTFQSTITVSSHKGRGKSAVLGLAIAGSIVLNYSNIFISSLSHDNIKILFRFLFKGLEALHYKEDEDYDLIESVNPKLKGALLGLNIFKDHPQAVRFILPGDVEHKLEQAELVIIDEAAAIPFTLLKHIVGPHTVLMASTTSGCLATGYSLTENLTNNIHLPVSQNKEIQGSSSVSLLPATGMAFENIVIKQPINYAAEDFMEDWLNKVFCLDRIINPHLTLGCPEPQQCRLFYVSQSTLFSYEAYAESFLQQLTCLFSSSKRSISPDYLLKLSDDPNCHLFCLLSPASCKNRNPEILCAILVHVELKIPFNIVHCANSQSAVHECFVDWEDTKEQSGYAFESISGIHILDLVTHPYYQRMGYGLRAFQILEEFYEGKWISLDENPVYPKISERLDVRKTVSDGEAFPSLLLPLTEVQPEKINYFLISYSMTSNLLRFWKKAGFVPAFITKEMNSAGEPLCMMLKNVGNGFKLKLEENWKSFKQYFFILLRSSYRNFSPSLSLNLLRSAIENQIQPKTLSKADIDVYLKPRNMKALEKYCQNLGDLHSIMPSIPILSKLYFENFFKGVSVPIIQEVILLSFGMQHRTIEEISKDMSLPSIQIHGLLNRTIRKLVQYLTTIIEKAFEKTIVCPEVKMEPLSQDLHEELEEEAHKIQKQQLEESKKLKDMDFSQYIIKGSEDDWEKALHSGRKTLVSIKSIKKKPEDVTFAHPKANPFKAKQKHMKKKR